MDLGRVYGVFDVFSGANEVDASAFFAGCGLGAVMVMGVEDVGR